MTSWKTYSLSEVVDKKRGISYGIVQPGTFVEDGVPIIKVNNLTERKLSNSDVQKVKPEVEAKYQRTKLKGNEISRRCWCYHQQLNYDSPGCMSSST